jgi:alcohol dehydrogenase class IV
LRTLQKPPGEPTLAAVELGARFLSQAPYARIAGVGGGSVLDWCRLSWAHEQRLLRLEDERLILAGPTERRAALWLVPTTCGTGAEAATVVVLTHEGRKLPVSSPAFLADQVVLDAQFLESVSEADLAASLCDTLSHGIEGFLSIVPSRLAKEHAVAAVRMAIENFPAHGESCRLERLMEAGFLGGLAASHCSVGVVHAFAHTMAVHGVPHRLGNALGLVAGMRTNASSEAFRDLLRSLGLSDAEDLARRIRPIRAAALKGVDHSRIASIICDSSTRADLLRRMEADVCLRTNPLKLSADELARFLDWVAGSIE